jgi:hypothetical protein
MTTLEEPSDRAAHPHRAMINLHRLAGTVGDGPPSIAGVNLKDALETVAHSDPSVISPAAKLSLLGALIRGGRPGHADNEASYRDLAAAVASPHGLDPQRLLDDLEAAAAGAKLADTESGRALPHEVTAFYMEDVCTTAGVIVDSLNAVWIFSEFETDADFEDVAAWVDPHNWPERSPMMFKGMSPIGPIREVPGGQGIAQWHGRFLETVQLVDQLNTELDCDYYRLDDLFAGMTYSLARSVDGQLDVDRGFLLVNELGRSRHVKALKIVGFVNDLWDDVAQWVCPIWTDFVRGAVRGGSHSGGRGPSSSPGRIATAIEQWANLVTGSGLEYLGQITGWARNLASGAYRADDIVRDGARFWLQVYRDLANAAALSYTTLEQLAVAPREMSTVPPWPVPASGEENLPGLRSAAVAPIPAPGTAPAPAGGLEGTTQPIPNLDPAAAVRTSDLVRIGIPNPIIPASSVRVSTLALSDSVTGVRIEADVSAVKDGLYVGEVIDRTGAKAPVQLYVSRAVGRLPG